MLRVVVVVAVVVAEGKGHSGLYVKEVAKLGALATLVKEGDVLLEVNGKRIGNDMTVKTRGTETSPCPK